MDRTRAGIVVFPEVEVLDFCGPFEVLAVTRLDESRRREVPSPFEVVLVAETADVVVASGGLRVLPDYDLASCPKLDVLVVPGGWGTRKLVDNEGVVAWIRKRASDAELVASVCTGSFCSRGQACLTAAAPRPTGNRSTGWHRRFRQSMWCATSTSSRMLRS